MSFFNKLKTVADGITVAMDEQMQKKVKRLSNQELLNKLSMYEKNKYYLAEAEKRRLV